MTFKNIIFLLVNFNGDMDSKMFNNLLAALQGLIGVEHGDVASHFFSEHYWEDMDKEERRKALNAYIAYEITLL